MIITAINDSEDSELWLYLKELQISQNMETDSCGFQNIN